jgi:hypothetical protein
MAPFRIESGGYAVQPEAAGPRGAANERSITTEDNA